MEKTKSRIVGVRVNKDQEAMLSEIQKRSKMNKSEIILQGLETLAEYYALGPEQEPMETALRRMEKEALHHMVSLKKIRKKEEAIRDFVREIRVVDEIIDKHGCEKNMLIQIMLDVQKQNNWLSKPALMWISERLGVQMAQIMRIATFYTAFSLEPQGRHMVQVCTGTACHVRGSEELLTRMQNVMKVAPGQTDEEQQFTLKTVNCLGCCAMGPVITVDGDYYSNPNTEQLKQMAEKYE